MKFLIFDEKGDVVESLYDIESAMYALIEHATDFKEKGWKSMLIADPPKENTEPICDSE